eukprot:UN30294
MTLMKLKTPIQSLDLIKNTDLLVSTNFGLEICPTNYNSERPNQTDDDEIYQSQQSKNRDLNKVFEPVQSIANFFSQEPIDSPGLMDKVSVDKPSVVEQMINDNSIAKAKNPSQQKRNSEIINEKDRKRDAFFDRYRKEKA